MGVEIEERGDAGVSEPLGGHLGVYASLKHGRRGSVPEAMDTLALG